MASNSTKKTTKKVTEEELTPERIELANSLSCLELVAEKEIRLEISKALCIGMDSEIVTVEIENCGAGDLYINDTKAEAIKNVLIMPGEKKEFGGFSQLMLFSTCRPLVKIRMYK